MLLDIMVIVELLEPFGQLRWVETAKSRETGIPSRAFNRSLPSFKLGVILLRLKQRLIVKDLLGEDEPLGRRRVGML